MEADKSMLFTILKSFYSFISKSKAFIFGRMCFCGSNMAMKKSHFAAFMLKIIVPALMLSSCAYPGKERYQEPYRGAVYQVPTYSGPPVVQQPVPVRTRVQQQPYYYQVPNSRSYYNPYEFQQPYGRNPYSDYDQYYVPPNEYYNREYNTGTGEIVTH